MLVILATIIEKATLDPKAFYSQVNNTKNK